MAVHRVHVMPESQPTPERVFAAAHAYQTSNALKTAVELDLFTAIHEGADTAATLADRLKSTERRVRILCDFLVTDGFLSKRDSTYSLAPDAVAFLVKSSPAYLGDTLRFLLGAGVLAYHEQLTNVMRNGITQDQSSVAPNNELWVEFARNMAPLMRMPAEMMAERLGADSGEPWKVLDIAAGHGTFGIAIARRNPQAEIHAVDWDAVLNVARENATLAGVSSRYWTIPGSAFDVDFGGPYDVALLTNFLHHFDFDTNVALIRKVRAALKPTGRVATLEFVPNEDRVSPPVPARFAMHMLADTAGGEAYPFSELRAMFEAGGFSRNELVSLQSSPQTLIVSSI